jgi:multicomponent Na+:H+ antiporter subunit F
LLGLVVSRIVRAETRVERILALDLLTLLLIALIALLSGALRTPYYMDAALILALLAFVGTVTAARYHLEGRLF